MGEGVFGEIYLVEGPSFMAVIRMDVYLSLVYIQYVLHPGVNLPQ
jgi:hypothetical protein